MSGMRKPILAVILLSSAIIAGSIFSEGPGFSPDHHDRDASLLIQQGTLGKTADTNWDRDRPSINLSQEDIPTTQQQPVPNSHSDLQRVVIKTAKISEEVNATLEIAGAEIHSHSGKYLEISIPGRNISTIRNLSWVKSVHPVATPVQSETSSGVDSMGASKLHNLGVTGDGVKIGILTTGVNPNSSEYSDQVISSKSFHPNGMMGDGTKHGTAVSEVVSDTAPNSSLVLATFDSGTEFKSAVDWMKEKQVDVIVMAISFPAQPDDGTGFYADVVSNTTTNGVIWANSAGNAGQLHWQGKVTDSDNDGWHNFDENDEVNALNNGSALQAGETVSLYLKWNDFPDTTADYTAYLFDNERNVIARSERPISNYPVEILETTIPADGTYHFAILGNNTEHTVEVFGHGKSVSTFEYIVKEGSIRSPTSAEGIIGVGAYHVFDGELASYSAAGPTTDGRRGVDILGPSGVETQAYDVTFAGTSAAAPHIGGAVALFLEINPKVNRQDVESALINGGRDIGPVGVDRYTGGGLAKISRSAEALDPTVPISITTNKSTISPGEWVSVEVERSDTNEPVDAVVSYGTSIDTTGSDGELALQIFEPGDYNIEASSVTDPPTADFNTDSTTIKVSQREDSVVRTLSQTEVSPGEEVAVSLTKNATTSSISFNESFSPAVENVTLKSVTIDGVEANPMIAASSESSLLVTLTGVSEGSPVRINYSLAIPENASVNSVFSVTGEVADATTIDVSSDEIMVGKKEVHLDLSANQSQIREGDSVQFLLKRADSDSLVSGMIIHRNESYVTGGRGGVNITFSNPGIHELVGSKSANPTTKFVNDSVEVSVGSASKSNIRNLSSTTIKPGGTTTITLRKTAESQSVTFSESFAPEFSRSTLKSASVNGEPVNPVISIASKEGVLVTFSNLDKGDELEIVYTVQSVENTPAGSEYQITGEVTDSNSVPLPTDIIRVEEDSPLPGVAGDYDTDGDGRILLAELSNAAVDYSQGKLQLTELSKVAIAYAQTSAT